MIADLRRCVALAAAWVAIVIGVALILRGLVPALDGRGAALVIIVLLSLLTFAGVSFARWWQAVGYTPRRDWRSTGWLAVPAVLTLLPLVAGIKPLAAETYAVLIAGYALTGFAEETMFRGIMVKILERRSPLAIAAISAVLFGLVHLGNIPLRGEPAIVAAQAVGAAAFGFGFAALRLRTNALLPLVVLHAVQDLFLQMGNLPLIPAAVAQDVVLFGLGLWLLRRPADAQPR